MLQVKKDYVNKSLRLSVSIIAAVVACLYSTALNHANAASTQTITVSDVAQLTSAINTANSSGGNTTILLQNGTYTLSNMLNIKAPHITVAGQSGDRTKVVIQGDAMSSSAKVPILFRVVADYFEISNVTLQKCRWHLIQIVGENDADYPIVRNCILRDGYQQLLKGSINNNTPAITTDNGIVENCLFEYSAGIGPQYYIGGIDVHGGKNWIVRNNKFRNIISPSQTVAEHAIHFWNGTANTLVEGNTVINCDRAIGFGLDGRGNVGGIIRNNMIYHAANVGNYADVGIYLVESPNTKVYNNTIIMQNSYPNSIEYRFAATKNVLIENNLTNKPIIARNGATGTVSSNITNASLNWFKNPASGDLHLTSQISSVIDQGKMISGLTDDFDRQARPQGSGCDIGADEFFNKIISIGAPRNLKIVQ